MLYRNNDKNHQVAPLAGAWIEITITHLNTQAIAVAPLARAWIEIIGKDLKTGVVDSRSPRGSVD